MEFFVFLLPILALGFKTAIAADSCPQANGTFPVSGSCDKYIECRNGVAVEKLCPDGLLFNDKATGYPCVYPNELECSLGPDGLQTPQPTADCPHQFGFYRVDETNLCDSKFKQCQSGVANEIECPNGLAWNPETYVCDYPDQVKDCDAAAFLGFNCPAVEGQLEGVLLLYPDPNNRQQYFVCINERPRRFSCTENQVFDEELKQCKDNKDIENTESVAGN